MPEYWRKTGGCITSADVACGLDSSSWHFELRVRRLSGLAVCVPLHTIQLNQTTLNWDIKSGRGPEWSSERTGPAQQGIAPLLLEAAK